MEKKKLSFEESLDRLDEIVTKLENGNEGLDGSLKLYEEGINLVRDCSKQLESAEQKVRMLQMTKDGAVLTDFTPEDGNA